MRESNMSNSVRTQSESIDGCWKRLPLVVTMKRFQNNNEARVQLAPPSVSWMLRRTAAYCARSGATDNIAAAVVDLFKREWWIRVNGERSCFVHDFQVFKIHKMQLQSVAFLNIYILFTFISISFHLKYIHIYAIIIILVCLRATETTRVHLYIQFIYFLFISHDKLGECVYVVCLWLCLKS